MWWPKRKLEPLAPDLTGLERVVRVPPLSRRDVRAIRLIAPHHRLRMDEASREQWEADQNGSCWGEFGALEALLRTVPIPGRILEIGPGLGRSAIFFTKKLGWHDSVLHLYEGEGRRTRYTSLGPRFEDSFCGSFQVLRSMLAHNGVGNAEIMDAAEFGYRLRGLPGPYDLVYSFYAIGFHWGLEHFLDEVVGLMHETSIGIFTVPPEFEPFEALDGVDHRIIRWKAVWPRDAHLRLLALSPGALPGTDDR